jgi:hypothetical protein
MAISRISSNGHGKPGANGQAARGISLVDRESQATLAMNSRRDRITQLWQEAEDRLKRIGIHSAVWVPTNSYEPEGFPHDVLSDSLIFAKVESGWRICYGVTDSLHDCMNSVKPIAECNMHIRLGMIPFVGRLRQKVVEEAEQIVPKLDSAIGEFERELASW